MRLLLISNSTMAGESYLKYPINEIRKFLGEKQVQIIFIPYAAVTFRYDEYVDKVNERFASIGQQVLGIHTFENKIDAIANAEAIIIGGGNTWHLSRKMREYGLFEAIRKKIESGTPYIGWSAGSNVACPTIKTTNDMPIVDPLGMEALNLVPFQINPHYIDANPHGHAGETREQRIEEFLEVNPNTNVIGLREGTMLFIDNDFMKLIGNSTARIFKKGQKPLELGQEDSFSHLLLS